MTLPTQTWRIQTPPTLLTKASAATAAEVIAMIRQALIDDTANHWEVAGYDGTTTASYLMIRRKGSPSGILGSFRILIFGGSNAPSVSAMQNGHSAAINRVYIGVCEDAGVDVPDVLPSVGNPFPGKKWTGGIGMGTPSTAGGMFTSTINGDVTLFSCDRMFGFVNRRIGSAVVDEKGWMMVAGEIIDPFTGSNGIWGLMVTTGGIGANHRADRPYSDIEYEQFIPYMTRVATGVGQAGGYHNGSSPMALSRAAISDDQTVVVINPLYTFSGVGILYPILMMEAIPVANTNVWNSLGILRQMRYGPYGVGFKYVRDSLNVVQAIQIGPQITNAGQCLFLTQAP